MGMTSALLGGCPSSVTCSVRFARKSLIQFHVLPLMPNIVVEFVEESLM